MNEKKHPTPNKNLPVPEELSQDEAMLRGIYVLTYLKHHLGRFVQTEKIKSLDTEKLKDLFAPEFIEHNASYDFEKGGVVYVLERREYAEYMEVALTRFPNLGNPSKVISEGVRVRLKRNIGGARNLVEYHIKNRDEPKTKKSLNATETFSKSVDFIDTIG